MIAPVSYTHLVFKGVLLQFSLMGDDGAVELHQAGDVLRCGEDGVIGGVVIGGLSLIHI